MFRNNPHYHELPYRTLVDQAVPASMFVHDHNGDFIEVNRQACESGESESNNRIDLRFTVRVTGIGIPNEQQQALFSPFAQADRSITRWFGETGLGLATSRKLVNLMGGKLQPSSVVGKGNRFWFVLPLQNNLKAERIPVKLTDIDLPVVDDHKSARVALLAISQGLGCRAEATDSGRLAIIHTMDSINLQGHYDVLLINWKMPVLDGLAAAQALRKVMPGNHHKPNWRPIILMATAYDELRSHPDIAAVDKVLLKPATPSALSNVVAEAVQRREPHAFSQPPPKKLTPGVRVLVVDDSVINCEVARRILEESGDVVSEAHNGEEALQWLSPHADEVDIILRDVQIPQMDGHEAPKQIKQNPNLVLLPVIAVIAKLLIELQASLGINNSATAEPLLLALEIDLGIDSIAPIHAQFLNFNFRKAEALIQVLLNDIDRLNHV